MANLAAEMRALTTNARENDKTLVEVFNNALTKIRDEALNGKSEICFYDICHPCMKWYSQDNRDKLVDYLERHGFKVKKGIQLGKGMGSWDTPYVVW